MNVCWGGEELKTNQPRCGRTSYPKRKEVASKKKGENRRDPEMEACQNVLYHGLQGRRGDRHLNDGDRWDDHWSKEKSTGEGGIASTKMRFMKGCKGRRGGPRLRKKRSFERRILNWESGKDPKGQLCCFA